MVKFKSYKHKEVGMRNTIRLFGLGFAILTCSIGYADDDALRDLGSTAKPGEVVKWDGSQWQNAHDNVGVDAVTVTNGLIASTTNGVVTISAALAGSGTSNKIARVDHGHVFAPPIGTVSAWMKSMPNTPPLPDGWVECNGQVLSDQFSPYNGQIILNLNGAGGTTQRFLRGATVSGGVGGADNITLGHSSNDSKEHFEKYPNQAGYNNHSFNNKPPYCEVVWIMRVK